MTMKIAMIGAGSIGFTRKLMHDIVAVPELADTVLRPSLLHSFVNQQHFQRPRLAADESIQGSLVFAKGKAM
ncbi:MAG: hypothetical protein E6I80_00530 [Chloroflexi bacterium]|nr:MAG: hypothetical protein E6I80_00530 [Chloroflexota bacterium]